MADSYESYDDGFPRDRIILAYKDSKDTQDGKRVDGLVVFSFRGHKFCKQKSNIGSYYTRMYRNLFLRTLYNYKHEKKSR